MATWSIANLEHTLSDGGVTVAHWRCEDSETVGSGDDAVTYTSSMYGSCSFTPDADADDFIAYDSLTEADVIRWVQAEAGQSDVVTESLGMTEESTKVILNDVEYDVADFTDEQRVMVAHISSLDAKLTERNAVIADARFNIDQLRVARQGFVDMLIKAVEDQEVTDADDAEVPDSED